jgi:large subunit ribosomal protein L32
MRHTRGHTNNRRSHHALKDTNIVTDKETGNLRLPHRLDEVTGMYRGKQIAEPKAVRVSKKSVKGPSTEPEVAKHVHDHAIEEHANAEVKAAKGVSGKVATGGRPKARSGFGGGA